MSDNEKSATKADTVVVNGVQKEVATTELTFDQVVDLAYNPRPTGPFWEFTVSYRRGDDKKPEGTLLPGGSVKVKDGMIFNVTATDKS